MYLKQVDPRDLHPNPWNTNAVSADGMEKLITSLKRHGWVRPVLARETEAGLEILGGQHRVEAAIHLEHETVPVAVLDNMSDQKAKEIGLIDNARYGQDDALELAGLLSELGGAAAMAEFLPISDAELSVLGVSLDDEDIDDLLDDDDRPSPEPEKKAPKTHRMMRFKIPVEDADAISDMVKQIMAEQEFLDADSLTNAGDALVHIFTEWSASRLGEKS